MPPAAVRLLSARVPHSRAHEVDHAPPHRRGRPPPPIVTVPHLTATTDQTELVHAREEV